MLLGAKVHGIPGPVCVGMCWNKHIILLYSLGNGRKKRVEVGALGRCQDVIEERVVDTWRLEPVSPGERGNVIFAQFALGSEMLGLPAWVGGRKRDEKEDQVDS